MADGEVNVSVRAEGVDDAAGELDAGAAAGGDGDGGGGGGGLGGGAGKSSGIGKLLTRIAALLVFLGPILDVLGAVTNVLTAFVAPLAVMLMRLLRPVLGFMLKLLPMWMSLTDTVDSMIENLSVLGKISALIGTLVGGLAGAKVGAVIGSIIGGFLGSVVPGFGTAIGAAIGAKVGAFVGGIVGGITGGITLASIGEWINSAAVDTVDVLESLPERIWSFLQELPNMFADVIGSVLPDFSGIPGVGGDGGLTQRADDATDGRLSDARDTVVNISGGLETFVDGVTQSGTLDWP